MRFKDFLNEEYIPTKKELRDFDLVSNGFGEVAEYETLFEQLIKYKTKLKFPYHDQLGTILKNNKDIYSLRVALRRWLPSTNEKIQHDINKMKGIK
jgi:hypothetical protein